MTRPSRKTEEADRRQRGGELVGHADDAVLEGQFLRIGVGEQQPVEPRHGAAPWLWRQQLLGPLLRVTPLNRSGV